MTELEYIEYQEDLFNHFIFSPWNIEDEKICLNMMKNIGISPRMKPRNIDIFENAMYSYKRFMHDDIGELTENEIRNIKEGVRLFLKKTR